MGALPPDLLTMISVFAPLVSERGWQRAQVLLIGALLVPGRRTVASAGDGPRWRATIQELGC